MQLVGAGLQVDVDDAAGGTSIFRVVSVGEDAHLADRFNRWPNRVGGLIEEVDGVDVVVDAVQQEIILSVGADAVGGESAVVAVTRAILGRNYAWSQTRQIRKVALAAQRNIGEGPAGQARADLCALGLK